MGLVAPAYAQQAPVSQSITDFSGGLNNFTASIYLNKNESPDLLNVTIDEPLGKLVQRKGYELCGRTPSGNTATNLYNYNKQDGSRFLIVTDNETVWQTEDCENWTTVWDGLSADNLPRFATIIDKLWVVNGSTYPVVWDGANAVQLDGENDRPLAPKAKYIAWWKSRVFLANTATDPSGLFFSALVSPQGQILDPAVSTGAWANTNNLIYMNRDDGSPIYGIKIYRDNLYGFKETGILRVLFNDEYTLGGINVSKTVSSTGSKFQESITEMDDSLLRFVGRDGVYSFNGSNVKRVSAKWTPTFYDILQPSMGEAYQVWDSAADFSAGTLTNLVTNTQGHLGQLALPVVDRVNWSFESGGTNWTLYGNAQIHAVTDIDIGGQAYGTAATSVVAGGSHLVSMDWQTTSPYGGRAGFTVQILSESGSGLASKTHYTEVQNGYNTGVRDFISLAGITGKVKLRVTNAEGNGHIDSEYFNAETMPGNKIYYGYAIGNQWVTINPYLTIIKSRFDLPNISTETPKVFLPMTGTFESQDIQAAGLSQWRLFDAIYSAAGQTAGFELKVADTQANLASATYGPITPGVLVSATTNSWLKWRGTVTTTDEAITPYIDRVGVNWVTGPQSKSAIVSTNYQSRYWVAAATDPANAYNTMTMVESKSPLGSYTKFDLPISAMCVWNNKLYGSIGNTDKIVQLDTGDTDDGATINSYWDSRDELYTSPIVYKSINRMIIDYERLPDNPTLQIGLSNNLGASFSYKTLDTGADTLVRNTKIINMDANRTLQFRSRIQNSTPGVGYTILGIHTFGSESNFTGN